MLNSGLTYGANEDEWHSMLQALTLQDDRGSLPPLAKPFPAIQPWKVIKDAFGSDQLMAMPMPMQLHEPTSELTKRAEELAYASLLNQAALDEQHSIQRHLKVAAFAMSFCQGNVRTTKPVAPLLGETLALVDERQGFRLISEEVFQAWGKLQVPSIGAWSAEGQRWTLQGECEPKVKFSLAGHVDILGHTWIDHLTFHDGEEFVWTKGNTRVNNLIAGKQYLSVHGALCIKALKGPSRSVHIKYLETGMLSKNQKGQVEGWIQEQPKGLKLSGWKLRGNIYTHLDATGPDGRTTMLWKATLQPNDPRYGMTPFVLQLNHLTEGLRRVLPPTDTRLRPDLRLLEQGNLAQAEGENRRLDKLNRSRVIGARSLPPPRWFESSKPEADGTAPVLRYRYKGGYWEARDGAGFSGIPNIFES